MISMFNVKMDQMKILVTSECNLSCTHCFRAPDKNKYQLPFVQVTELIDYAIETSCSSISFSGGEFFVHQDAYRILDYCYEKKMKVKILSNATQIRRDEYFSKFTKEGLLSFQISLDGTRERHDSRRGCGIFDKVISNVSYLNDLGIPVSVSMTVDQDNMYDVLDVLEMPYFAKCNFVPVAYAGERTRQGRPIFDEKYAEYEEIIRTLYKSREDNQDVNSRCRMFPHQLGIKYDGTVYPCAVARDYGIFCMGNIMDTPIKSIVESYLKSDEAKELLDYTSNDISDCKNCRSNTICNKGCRARAYKYFGKLMAPDPFSCFVFNEPHDDVPLNCLFWGER